MTTYRALSYAVGLGFALFAGDLAMAASLPALTEKTGRRPKFTSKIHIPVPLAAEVTTLPPAGYKLVFADEFNGDALDTQKWGYRTGSKLLSTQKPENVSVGGGTLKIALRKESAEGKDYTGGGVISRERFVYGYYEARFRTPDAEGWHTSFWTQKHGFPVLPPGTRALLELDFCEQDGGDPNFYSFGIINKIPDAKKRQTWNAGRWVIENAPDTSAAFHVWACEFTPETIRFYFDGRLTKEESASGFPHDDMNVWLSSIASTLKGDRWVDDSKLPNAAVFDYIRVYQHPKYRAAEEAVRTGALRRPLPATPTKSDAIGQPKNLN
jgi:beta-glucanase (GH16 family)